MRKLVISSLSLLSLVAPLAGRAHALPCAGLISDSINWINQNPSLNYVQVQIVGANGTSWGSWGQGALTLGHDATRNVTTLTGNAATYYSDRTWTQSGNIFPFSPFNTDNVGITLETRSDGNVWLDTYNDPTLWSQLSCADAGIVATGNLFVNVNGYGAVVRLSKQQHSSLPPPK